MARWERQLVNSVPASAFDAAARERVGELLRVTRDSNPTRLTAGTVVEFIHNGQLRCGCLKATPVGRRALQVMDCQGQERCLRADKILHYATEQVAVKPQDRGLEQLRLIDRQRAISAGKVDLQTLRELALEAGGLHRGWTVDDLCRIHDSAEQPTSLQRAAMLRALFEGQEFRRVAGAWTAREADALEGALGHRRRGEAKRQLLEAQAQWLRAVGGGKDTTPPSDADQVLDSLAAYVLSETDEGLRDSIDLVRAAHLHGRAAVLDVLVRVGYWDVDENLILHREQIPQVFTEQAEQLAAGLAATRPIWRGWPNWSQPSIGVSDETDSEICLRAWAVRCRRQGWRLRLHVALPCLRLTPDGPLAEEISGRGIRVDLPDQTLPLIPPGLLRAASFTTLEYRPALTVIVDVDASGDLAKAQLRRSRIRLRARVSPSENQNAVPSDVVGLVSAFRQRRQRDGGWEGLGGERFVQATGGDVACGRSNTENAHTIDHELHRLGEEALAAICAREHVVAVHRSRMPAVTPTEPWPQMPQDGAALFRRWQMEGHCASAGLQLEATPHAGDGTGPRALGLDPGGSSAELIMQRQLLSLVGVGPRIENEHLEESLRRQQPCTEAARAALSEGRRYWCLKWLSEHLTSRVTGWVAARRGAGYLVLLDELPMSAWVPADNGLSARVGDRVTVANERVHVRGDEVIFTDPRIEPPLESGSG